MHYALLLHNAEPAPGEIPDEAMAEMEQAFGNYLTALHEAGVFRGAEILQSSEASTTVTLRTGDLQVQDGPFAETKEALAGVFVIDVDGLDAALAWAEKCPGASYGTVEVRPVSIWGEAGAWHQTEGLTDCHQTEPGCPQREREGS